MSETCAARLFGPGLPPAGLAVTLALEFGERLTLLGVDAPRSVPLTALALRRAGFDGRGLEIAWQDAGGAWACQVLDSDAAARLLAGLPPQLAAARAGVEREARRAGRHHALLWTLVGAFVALPLLLIVLFLLAQDRIVGAIAARVPPEVERQLGAAAFAQVRAGTPLLADGAEVAAVKAVAARVLGADLARYRLHVAADDAVNAFALPGGDIVVNRGLLAATRNPTELAGVLAHEVQHVELRHGLEAMIRAAGMSVLWSLVVGDVGGSLAGQAADRLLTLKFSRDAERAADAQGFQLLVTRGIDPRGMVEFFATLAREQDGAPPALLSTHPASAEREAELARRLAQLPAGCCAPIALPGDWPPR